MATNDMQTFLPLLQPQVPVTPTAAPVPTAAANPALRRALITPTPAAPATPVTADSLRASFAALSPYLPGGAQLPAAQSAAEPVPATAVATPPTVTPDTASTAVTPSAQTTLQPGNPQVLPGVNDSVARAVAARVVGGGGGVATPRVGRDATAPATVGTASALPAFAPGTPDLSQAPNSVTYDDSGRAVGGRDGQGVEIIRGGVSNMPSLPGGGRTIAGRFVDPRDAIAEGYNQQLAYQQASISNLLSAFRNSDGLAATKHALAQAIGMNNFASVQGQGTNTVNSAIGNIAAAGQGAGAAMYGANLNYLTNANRLGFEQEQAANTPVQIGAEPMGITGKDGTFVPTMALPTYGMRGQNGAAPRPVNPTGARTALPAGLKVGAAYKGSDGVYNVGTHKVTIKSGQVAAIE